MDESARHRFEEALGHRFADPARLVRALTHTSAVPAFGDRLRSNERLEFLGDRVLALVVAEMLMGQFPHEDEGALARRHAALVRREALVRVARSIDLAPLIVMDRGEEGSGGRDNPGLLADACEAVIGALYLDGGIEAAARFIRAHWLEMLDEDVEPPKDAKTGLQEWAQGRGLPLPEYRVASRSGPAHDPVFTVRVAVAGKGVAEASGRSKRAAEQAAAATLLERLEHDDV